jgi:hypothetical protein
MSVLVAAFRNEPQLSVFRFGIVLLRPSSLGATGEATCTLVGANALTKFQKLLTNG